MTLIFLGLIAWQPKGALVQTNGAAFQSDLLVEVASNGRSSPGRMTCVTICHQEALIVEQFLDHYRALGCDRFLVVDDISTDGTAEILSIQDDVVLFRPRDGVSFKDNLGLWRQALLDHYCEDRWVTLPDVDEFLYHRDMPGTLETLAAQMDEAGDQALLGVMVDMYADEPLGQKIYDGQIPIQEAYPYFDGQGTPPLGMRIVAPPSRFARRFPTPRISFTGGVRERLFFQRGALTRFQTWMLSQFAHMRRPLHPGALHRLQNRVVRAVTRRAFSDDQLVMNKFALLKWQRGTRFSRAPHFIDRELRVSERLAVFLHFKFYKGQVGFQYNVDRGQHAGGATMYQKMVAQKDALNASPMTENSVRFRGVSTLGGLLR